MAEQDKENNQNTSSPLIDEALMDAHKIQEALKSNTKNMLRDTMREEIDSIVKESINEDEDDEEYDEEEVGDEEGDSEEDDSEEPVSFDYGDDEREEAPEGGEEEAPEGGDFGSEIEGGDEEAPEGGDFGSEIAVGGEEEYDMTSVSDEDEIIKVYKQLSGDDQVEVVDDDSVKITDQESGNVYKVETGGGESEEEDPISYESTQKSKNTMTESKNDKAYRLVFNEDKQRKAGHDPQDQVRDDSTYEETPEENDVPTDEENHGDNLEGGFEEDEATADGGSHADHIMDDIDEETLLEALKSLYEESGNKENTDASAGAPEETHDMGDEYKGGEQKPGEERTGVTEEDEIDEQGEQHYDYEKDTDYRDERGDVPGEQGTGPDEREANESEHDMEENKSRAQPDLHHNRVRPQGSEEYRTAPIGREKSKAPGGNVGESNKKYKNLLKEAEQLKEENKKFKSTLKEFRKKLAETVVFNNNLTLATRLFLENSTTAKEKEDILKRFDEEASTIEESKKVYNKILNELKNKKPVNESVEEKLEDTKTSSSSKAANGEINESTAYVDESTAKIKDLISKVDKS